MGLIDRITSALRRTQTTTATTVDATPTPPLPTTLLQDFQVERDRASIVALVRRMVDEDPRASGVLKTLARDATRGGFTVAARRGAGSGTANREAAALIERLGLVELIADWVELTLRDGDSFLEVAVDANNDIVSVTRKPTLQLHRASDDRDTFPDPARAYWWADELWGGLDAPKDATWFADWQIIHARWSHDEGSRYGRPLFASARTAWKRIAEGELDIAVRRKTRAGLKFNHKFPQGTQSDVIDAYKEQNRDALGNPTAALSDFFGTVEISAIQGDGRLNEIEDVQHHIRTWFVASPVPMSLLGYGQDLNRDVLDEQQQQYERALDAVCAWIDKDIIQPLVELQWLLKGIWPQSLTYTITRPPRKPITPEMLTAASDAIGKLKATGLIAEELLFRLLGQLLPGIDPEEAKKLIAAEREAAKPAPAPQPAPASPELPTGNSPPGSSPSEPTPQESQ